jgi:hypothetical protein
MEEADVSRWAVAAGSLYPVAEEADRRNRCDAPNAEARTQRT